MDILEIADWLHVPVFSAFLLGIMASIGPCPMASNVAALAYISRKISDRRYVITGSILYTLGRMITYTVLGMLIIYAGLNIPAIADFLKEFGVVAMGPLLITVGIIMLFIDRIEFGEGEHQFGDAAGKFADMGLLGALPLGMVLALAFCPYSAVLFFYGDDPAGLADAGWGGSAGGFCAGHRFAGDRFRSFAFAGCDYSVQVAECYRAGRKIYPDCDVCDIYSNRYHLYHCVGEK